MYVRSFVFFHVKTANQFKPRGLRLFDTAIFSGADGSHGLESVPGQARMNRKSLAPGNSLKGFITRLSQNLAFAEVGRPYRKGLYLLSPSLSQGVALGLEHVAPLGLKSSPERAKQVQPRATPWDINEIFYPAPKGRPKRVWLIKKCVMLPSRFTETRNAPHKNLTKDQLRIPTTAPVIKVASTPVRIERGPRAVISRLRSGAMLISPPIRMPRLPMFANPHMA